MIAFSLSHFGKIYKSKKKEEKMPAKQNPSIHETQFIPIYPLLQFSLRPTLADIDTGVRGGSRQV